MIELWRSSECGQLIDYRVVRMNDDQPIRPLRGIWNAVMPVGIGRREKVCRVSKQDHRRPGKRFSVRGDGAALHRGCRQRNRARIVVGLEPNGIGSEAGSLYPKIDDGLILRRVEAESSLRVRLFR